MNKHYVLQHKFSSPLCMLFFAIDVFFNQLYLYKLSPPPPNKKTKLISLICMQRNDLAALSGVSAWTQNYQFLKFLFLMQRQKYQRHWKLWEALKPFMFGYITTPSPVSVWFRSYIFILKVVPINTLKPEKYRFVCWHCSRFDHLSAHSRIKTFCLFVNTCSINHMISMYFGHA